MIAVAILAAGRGTRMKSDYPKVLHTLGGRSLVERAINSCNLINPAHFFVIVGYQGNLVKQALNHLEGIEFVEQSQQLGTGHAIQKLLPILTDFEGDLLVLNGDVPLLRPETINELLITHKNHGNAATLLTAHLPNPKGYGRVFCDGQNLVTQIVEDKDCNAAQKQNHRINAGIYCFNWQKLATVLPQLTSNNSQNEYYLTEVFNYLEQVMAQDIPDYLEILGINDRQQLATAYDILQTRVKDAWMTKGITMVAPDTITIDDSVQLHPDVVIEPQTHLRGNTVIGAGSRIGPGSLIENSQIGNNVTVMYSVVTDSIVESHTRVGPYAHLRGQAIIGEGCRVGNFVEIKNSSLGAKTNAAHLSYLGDATLGDQVNIGAGTITANYDGVKKQPTTIGDRSKTGANSVLVAPVNLGADVTVAAGSVVTKDVPDDSLVITRPPQVVKPGWRPQPEV
ncbi:MAG: bifunctional UDP-N-acetylglucosamine diphosphorylase/glucosamine-1-phosphate N-acetyltransferase GlmU [Gloeocapsa sp. DLM2.Bin57]|nr:MAG: bifunctional UDP-N-acetylglucosamine diphosphorylase/glucosamine-1-phosphate N-acetyltransferase GlmU [Gloeocapsa sp. DLM2.Bin57]